MATGIEFLLICGWIWLSRWLHEGAHWAVARLFGWEVVGFQVGTRPWLVERVGRGRFFRVGWMPGLGRVWVDLPWTGAGRRWRGAAIALAGPTVDLVLTGVFMAGVWWALSDAGQAYAMAEAGWSISGGAYLPLGMVFHASMALVSLVPQWHARKVRSDGLEALDFARGKTTAAVDEWVRTFEQSLVHYGASGEAGASGFSQAGGAAQLDYRAFETARRAGNLAETQVTLEQLERHPAWSAETKAAWWDRWFSTILQRNEVAWAERAIPKARELVAALPTAATLRGSLGSLLVVAGRAEEAIPLLQPLTLETAAEIDRVWSAGYLAEAYAQQGQIAAARAMLKTSLELQPLTPAGDWRLRIVERLATETTAATSAPDEGNGG